MAKREQKMHKNYRSWEEKFGYIEKIRRVS
jgi:hypothetical protein